MPKSKRPRHSKQTRRRQSNPRLIAQPWKTAAVFDPIERIVDQLERDGTVTVTLDGMPVFLNTDGKWYSSVAAIEGVIQAFEIHSGRTNHALPIRPLHQLATKLRIGMPIFSSDTTAVRAALNVLRRAGNSLTADEAAELAQAVSISAAMDKVMEAA
ncbi:MAG: hypothetical protein H6R01_1520 [Burkholderiaceae bacterium]|nr:hypothetical protein [Burkholderiaceae bacterium]